MQKQFEMKYSEEQIRKFKEEYAKRRSKRITIFWVTLAFLLVVGFIAIPLLDALGLPRMTWGPFVYIIVFGLIILIALVWRCPVCNGLLGDIFNTKYCSRCGFKFHGNEQ